MREYINFLRQNLRSYFRKRRIFRTTSKDQVNHFKIGVSIDFEWYGSSYGGFYIHSGALSKDSIVYSIGIGKDISFDRKCILKHECKVYGFDPTPKSINWISNQDVPSNFYFYDFGISTVSGVEKFFLPVSEKGVSGSVVESDVTDNNKVIEVQMKSFDDITQSLGHSTVDVLKMDIEGSEYEVIEDILNSDCTINQILVEFHDRLFDLNEYRSKRTVEKLKEKGFEIFAFSKSFEEISFIRVESLK